MSGKSPIVALELVEGRDTGPTMYLRYDNGKLMQQWFCRTRTRQWHEWREVPGQ